MTGARARRPIHDQRAGARAQLRARTRRSASTALSTRGQARLITLLQDHTFLCYFFILFFMAMRWYMTALYTAVGVSAGLGATAFALTPPAGSSEAEKPSVASSTPTVPFTRKANCAYSVMTQVRCFGLKSRSLARFYLLMGSYALEAIRTRERARRMQAAPFGALLVFFRCADVACAAGWLAGWLMIQFHCRAVAEADGRTVCYPVHRYFETCPGMKRKEVTDSSDSETVLLAKSRSTDVENWRVRPRPSTSSRARHLDLTSQVEHSQQ